MNNIPTIDYRGVSKNTDKFVYWKWNKKLLPGSSKNFWEIIKSETISKFTTYYDKFGRKIYENDTVSVLIKHETKTRHVSEVKTGNGFYIDAHPAHKSSGFVVRKLSDYCGGYSNDCVIIKHDMIIDSSKETLKYRKKDKK